MNKNLNEELNEFLREDNLVPPPRPLAIKDDILRDLNTSKQHLYLKFFGLHFMASILTLSICPQFGVRIPFALNQLGHRLGHSLMEIHPALCGAYCGLVFMGLGALLSLALLRPLERTRIAKLSWYATLTYGLFNLGLLMGAHLSFETYAMNTGFLFMASWLFMGIGAQRLITFLGQYKYWKLGL